MRRLAAGIVMTLLLLAFVAQLALPAYLADRTRSTGWRSAEIVESSGSVAGIPAGPLTEFVVGAALERF